MVQHVVEHHIATVHGVLRIDARIIVGCCLQQSHENSGLVGSKVLGRRTEIRLGSSLDAESVRTKVDGVCIHREDFLLVKEQLDFHSRYPFLALHDKHLDARDVAQQSCRVLRANAEHVLYQLLGDGRCSTGLVVNDVVLEGSKDSLEVDTEMVIEALVFRVYQCLPEYGVDVFVGYRSTVLAEVFSNENTISTI